MERKIPKGPKTTMMSFRFSERTAKVMETLAKYYGRSKTDLIEELLEDEFKRAKKKDPNGIKGPK